MPGKNYPRWYLGGLTPDTPVSLIGDTFHHGTASLVLFEDDDRDVLEWVVQHAKLRKELLLVRGERRRWADHWLTRLAAGLTVLAVSSDIALNIYHLIAGK